MFIIDEAHLLAPEQLEELRLLTNPEMDSQSPFALLLVGQPTPRPLRLDVFGALDPLFTMTRSLGCTRSALGYGARSTTPPCLL